MSRLFNDEKACPERVFVAITPYKSLRDSTGRGGGTSKTKVFVAMSGGVDSSVAAFLLQKKGYDITGVFMKCWTSSNTQTNADLTRTNADNAQINECGWEKEATDARRVAEHLGIPFYVWDFEKEYKKKVVDYMIRGYKQGITPNPDVMCNREIKFGLFLEKALKLGADYVATGHYVRLRRHRDLNLRMHPNLRIEAKSRSIDAHIFPNNPKASFVDSDKLVGSCRLYQAEDTNKDQSYFLWTLTQHQLKHCLFPIGDYVKPDVRKIARKAGLPTADKKDSQGVCFLGKFSVADFLKKHIKSRRGAILTTAGEKIGEHDGAQFYTIGQRHGIAATSDLPIGRAGKKHATWVEKTNGKNRKNPLMSHVSFNMSHKLPLYVAAKDTGNNTLTVAEGDDNPALYKKEVVLTDVNLISSQIPDSKFQIPVLVRVRYRQPLVRAKLNVECDKRHGNNFRENMSLVFNAPVKFVAPGQSAVFYDKKGAMLGGGVIVSAK